MSQKLRIGFMGTPDFARSALQALCEQTPHEIVCVYSQPPRPKGRGHKVIASPVQQYADGRSIPVFTPLNLKDQEAQDIFAAHDLDLAIVAAYGLILPQAVLDAPRFGCVNIHASLLPRWRGASPINRAIWAGDERSGVCLMQMEAGLDTGPVLMEQSCAITDETTAPMLHDDLAAMSADMVVELMEGLSDKGALPVAVKQDNDQACYATMLSRDDGLIDWSKTALEIDRQVRALNPWPGTWVNFKGERFKILAAQKNDNSSDQQAGTVLSKKGDVVCGDGQVIRLMRVQPAGKKAMDFAAAFNGGYVQVGGKLL